MGDSSGTGGDDGAQSGNGAGPSGSGHSTRRRRDDARSQPRVWLQPFLLLTLEHWQIHGYELIRRMTMFGFEALDRGSVYRTLRQLEEDGLVSSDWDTSSHGPARRLYSLTESGRSYLNVWAGAFRGYQSMLDEFFTLYPAPSDASEEDQTERGEAENQASTKEPEQNS